MKKVLSINENVYPNAALLPLTSICDYSGRAGLDKVVVSNGKIVNVVSDNYGFLPNDKFFTVIEKQLKDSGINFETKYRNVNDCYFTADYIFTDGKFNVVNGKTAKDGLKPKLRFINSYDGSLQTRGFFAFFRQICTNGLHGVVDDVAFQVKHRGNICELVLPNIKMMLEKYLDSDALTITRRFEVLAERPVLDVNELSKFICDTTGVFKFESSDKNPEPGLNARIVSEIIAKEAAHFQVVPNAWIVYNAFNEWINSDTHNLKGEQARINLDQKVFATLETAFN